VNIANIVGAIEATGVGFRIDGDKVCVWYPDEERRKELAGQVAFLRGHRVEVAELLRARSAIPQVPNGVRLIQWKLKEPPVAIETCAVVTEPAQFANRTLEQLRLALVNPKRWVGWSVPQLIERLAQVGVVVLLDSQ
jgi:hypothetical protein